MTTNFSIDSQCLQIISISLGLTDESYFKAVLPDYKYWKYASGINILQFQFKKNKNSGTYILFLRVFLSSKDGQSKVNKFSMNTYRIQEKVSM